jgi:RNA polymerase-binding transcription factor DksA
MANNYTRFSNKELDAFKIFVELNLAKAKSALKHYQDLLQEIEEKLNDNQDDWAKGVMSMYDYDMISNIIVNEKKLIKDLELAIIRIRNKSYGICEVTGTLIDKNILRTNPTVTRLPDTQQASIYKKDQGI